MRDTKKVFRHAIFNTLNGNISVPVYDEKKKVGDNDDLFVLLSTQQESSDNTFNAWINDSLIDIEVFHKTGSEVSKDDMDDVTNEILGVLFPSPGNASIVQPEGFQIQNMEMERTITRTLEVSFTESILRTIITIKAQIVHN